MKTLIFSILASTILTTSCNDNTTVFQEKKDLESNINDVDFYKGKYTNFYFAVTFENRYTNKDFYYSFISRKPIKSKIYDSTNKLVVFNKKYNIKLGNLRSLDSVFNFKLLPCNCKIKSLESFKIVVVNGLNQEQSIITEIQTK